MPPKQFFRQTESRKSILITPSRAVSRPDKLEGGEETEIAAQISVPEEGGWGWVVVAAAFFCMFILDGVSFTFGTLINDMTEDLGVSDSLVALINSIAIALYFCAGPLASAFINRYGFRACAMSGSILCSCSLFFSYFVTNYLAMVMCYGMLAGLGYCLVNMSASLVVGFYFEKLRALAIGFATTGSCIGVMIFSPLNSYLVSLSGWRSTTLLHSGIFGLIFFLSMTFRPLLSLTVVKTQDDPTRTVTYLPNVSRATIATAPSTSNNLKPTVTEKLFSAVSNANFPTAATVVEEGIISTSPQPGPSTAPISRLTLTANHPQGVSRRHLKQVQSIMSRTSVQDKTKNNVDITINVHDQHPKKLSFWARLCHWEQHVPQSRPLYRDDAFYEGKVEKLPIYQKSMMDATTEGKSGLGYQLAVSRAVTAADLQEKRGVCTTAARRVLATMMDPKLLGRGSFILLSCSGFLTYSGFLVPYVYISDRNFQAGLPVYHCTLFLSVIGLSNAVGRLCIGAIACKIDPIKLYSLCCFVGGISTIVSNMSFDVYFQYGYCSVYGFFIAGLACLRSMIIVTIYGLDKLTNATGMLLLFQGMGSLLSTPLAGVLKNTYGYSIAFYIAGLFIVLSGIVILPIRIFIKKEKNFNVSHN